MEIIINGGIKTNAEIAEHLRHVDGVMIGREAYHNTMMMRDWDRLFYGSGQPEITYPELIQRLYAYAQTQLAAGRGTILRHMARHYLGLMHGLHGARTWRQMLSDAELLKANRAELILEAWAEMEKGL